MFPFDEIEQAVSKAAEAIGEVTGLSTRANTPTFNTAAYGGRPDKYGIVKPLVEHRPEKIEALGASFKDPAALVPALDALASSVRAAMRSAVKDGLPPAYDPGDGLGPISGEQQIAEELQRLGLMLAYAAVAGKATWKQPRRKTGFKDGSTEPVVWVSAGGAHSETNRSYHPKEAKWAVAVYAGTKPWIRQQFKQAMTEDAPPPPPPPPPPAKKSGPKTMRWQAQARLAKSTRLERSADARVWLHLPPSRTARVRPRASQTSRRASVLPLLAVVVLGPGALLLWALARAVAPVPDRSDRAR